MSPTQRQFISSLLLLCCGQPVLARSVKILQVHVELISPAGSALICDQRVADALRQVTGSCLSECESLVGFNSASCNTELGYDVVTLRGGIFGTAEDVIDSIPCIRATLEADGCGSLVNESISSVGSLRYIGGVDTASPTAAPQPEDSESSRPSAAPTTSPTLRESTLIPTESTSSPVLQPIAGTVEFGVPPTSDQRQPTAAPQETADTDAPSAQIVLEERTDRFMPEYIALIVLALTAAVLLCCLVVLIFWVKRSHDMDSLGSMSKNKKAGYLPHDCTSEESASWSSQNSSKKQKQQRQAEEALFGIDLPSLDRLRDDPSSVLEKDELSSDDSSSIREEKFDDASDDEYEAPPGEDETEVTCDASETAEEHSEYDFSVSAADFTRATQDLENGDDSASSVGSLTTNSFSHYFNFDERDMADEAKRRQFLNWLKASKIVPSSAKYSIEASLVTTYGPLRDEHRPTEVTVGPSLADHQESAGKLV